jgi:hypothetical protein
MLGMRMPLESPTIKEFAIVVDHSEMRAANALAKWGEKRMPVLSEMLVIGSSS